MLVAQKTIAAKGIGRWQGDTDRDDHIDQYIDDRIDIAVVPRRIGENDAVISQRRIVWKKGEGREYFLIRLEAHIDEPIDRQHQKNDVESRHPTAQAALLDITHAQAPFSCASLP